MDFSLLEFYLFLVEGEFLCVLGWVLVGKSDHRLTWVEVVVPFGRLLGVGTLFFVFDFLRTSWFSSVSVFFIVGLFLSGEDSFLDTIIFIGFESVSVVWWRSFAYSFGNSTRVFFWCTVGCSCCLGGFPVSGFCGARVSSFAFIESTKRTAILCWFWLVRDPSCLKCGAWVLSGWSAAKIRRARTFSFSTKMTVS